MTWIQNWAGFGTIEMRFNRFQSGLVVLLFPHWQHKACEQILVTEIVLIPSLSFDQGAPRIHSNS